MEVNMFEQTQIINYDNGAKNKNGKAVNVQE